MEQNISITISMEDLKTLVKDLISEYMSEHLDKFSKKKDNLWSYSQIFEKLWIRPERISEWVQKGLIKEYPVGATVKFHISDLFKAIQQLTKEMDGKKEVPIG